MKHHIKSQNISLFGQETIPLSVQAFLAYGVNHHPLDLGPVIPPPPKPKLYVWPEAKVPLFYPPMDRNALGSSAIATTLKKRSDV